MCYPLEVHPDFGRFHVSGRPSNDPGPSGRALRAVELAGLECRAVRHYYLGSEHLLAGLVREAEENGEQALPGLTPHAVRQEFVRLIRPGQVAVEGETPFTPRVLGVLRFALEEARGRGDEEIGTDHLLLGLLNLEGGVAAQVLHLLDVDADQARARVLARLSED